MKNNNKRFLFLEYTSKSKITCPYCKTKKSFTLYMDTTTGEVLSDEFGYCDKVNSCGYKKHPYGNLATPHVEPELQPEIPQKFVDKKILSSTITWYDKNPFVLALYTKLGDKILPVIKSYLVGTTKKYETVFWNVDNHGKIWNAKVMKYIINEYGEPSRDKSLHSYYKFKKEDGYKPLLFGMHLFDKEKETILVESEKTAIIGKFNQPNYNWIGVGSSTGLTLAKAKLFKDMEYTKKFYCCGDCDEAGRKAMNKWVDNLECFSLKAKPHDIGEQYTNGEDYADIFLGRHRSKPVGQ